MRAEPCVENRTVRFFPANRATPNRNACDMQKYSYFNIITVDDILMEMFFFHNVLKMLYNRRMFFPNLYLKKTYRVMLCIIFIL